MIRKIIKIDRDKCNGCGLCVTTCHEGAIALREGKAVLHKEHHCDGLGDCLPACPTGAISFEMREAPAYDEAAVQAAKAAPCACPGTASKALVQKECACTADVPSALGQWPVQLKLVPPSAPWFQDARLLIAADCCAYAYGNFHRDFIRDHVTLIGCPKLDEGDYTQKLTDILCSNSIQEVVVTRMEVPCCGGLERAVLKAMKSSGKALPCRIVTIRADGSILREVQY